MEAVKLQNTVQVKTRPGRATAAESAAQNDGFVKLLQEKRDMAEPKKAETDKAQDKGSQDKEVKDSVPEKTEEKAGKTEETEEGKAAPEDMLGEDALLQAMIQQAAAQMTGILPEVQESVQETVGEAAEAAENINPVESLAAEGQIQTMDAVQEKAEPVAQSLPQQPEDKGQDTAASHEESQNQTDMGIGKNISGDTKPAHDESAVQTVKESQPAVREEKKVQTAEETSQQPLYSTESTKEEPHQVFTQQRTEEIPLKTTQADLPQDLGKALAAKLPGSGGELTIELEPATLGKLTIKLVYEGERAAVSILSSNSKTLELLSQRATEIASILEEKTGQQTIIYTQPSQQQEEQDPNGNPGGHSSRENQGEGHENQNDNQHQTESFAQQLRLGLI